MSDPSPRVFDGHNDLLLRLHMAGEGVDSFFAGRRGHLDLERARRGGLGGGFFAVFVPAPDEPVLALDSDSDSEREQRPERKAAKPWSRDDAPYSPPLSHDVASAHASEMVDLLHDMVQRQMDGRHPVLWMRDREDIGRARQSLGVAPPGTDRAESARADASRVAAQDAHPIHAVLHFEGAEPIRSDLADLEGWYQKGLRSLGLVWSRQNDFAAGVPFKFPSDPDHFEGLTRAGFDLVRACDDLGIMVDLAHLNEKGFWDVARTSRNPLIVTHTAVLRLCASSRNLTDDQIRAVADSGGVVGLTFHCGDLRPDGRLDSQTPIDVLCEHLEALWEIAGPQHVALGSDFDGALMPRAIGDVSRLPALFEALRDRGHEDQVLSALACGNWLSALERVWK